MTTEIELKYLLSTNHEDNDAVVDKITTMLEAQDSAFTLNKKQLNNNYFDNNNLALRKMDMGLRIRSVEQEFEQTIKTAGKVVGCLHQRPEYNVSLDNDKLNLSLFPEHIWPENLDIAELQQSLHVIFNTNFSRQTWLITQADSVIELAFDQGKILTSSTEKTLVINELELELVSGEEKSLFVLAEQLMEVVQMTAGKLSKAARGYALYHKRDIS